MFCWFVCFVFWGFYCHNEKHISLSTIIKFVINIFFKTLIPFRVSKLISFPNKHLFSKNFYFQIPSCYSAKRNKYEIDYLHRNSNNVDHVENQLHPCIFFNPTAVAIVVISLLPKNLSIKMEQKRVSFRKLQLPFVCACTLMELTSPSYNKSNQQKCISVTKKPDTTNAFFSGRGNLICI